MRAALSILGLVIVFAIIMFNAKHQMKALAPPPSASASAGASAPRNLPESVQSQVQNSMDQAASAAASAAAQQ